MIADRLAARPGMYMPVRVLVRMVVHLHRHEVESSVSYLRFGHQRIGERAHLTGTSSQHQSFNAILVVEMDVHRRQDDVVMLVLQIG